MTEISSRNKQKWPKIVHPLSQEREAIREDFMRYWHEVLPRQYGFIEQFNQGYPVRHSPKEWLRTLEIGAGLGEHLKYENLPVHKRQNCYAVEIIPHMAQHIEVSFPGVRVVQADCQTPLNFLDNFFDRILAIHVLEHLPDLPASIREIYRLINKNNGTFIVMIPCEGGMVYKLARRVSAQRIFEKRYGTSYDWFIDREHINVPEEIMNELLPYFIIKHRSFFPTFIPSNTINLCIGLTLAPKRQI